LALKLFSKGDLDAQYLVGMIADPKQISKEELDFCANNASWSMIWEYSVP
jgi:hypothetical protein